MEPRLDSQDEQQATCGDRALPQRALAWQALACIAVGVLSTVLSYLPFLHLSAFSRTSNIRRVGSILLFHGAADSWRPINDALGYVNGHASAAGLYQATYFQSDFQFIYPPQAVALFQCLKTVLRFDLGDEFQAKLGSWLCLPLLAYVLYRIVLESFRGRDIVGSPANRAILALYSFFAVFLFFPITNGYAAGNIQTYLTLMAATAALLRIQGRPLLAGIAFGVAVIVKPQVGLLLLWTLYGREFAFVAGCAIVIAVMSLSSLAMYGLPLHLEYYRLLSYLSGRGESFYYSHSIESAMYRLIHVGNNIDWDPRHRTLKPVGWIHHLSSVLGLLLVGWTFVVRSANTVADRTLHFVMVYIAIVIASPVAYEHHFGLAYIGLALALLVALQQAALPRYLVLLIALTYALMANAFPPLDYLADTNLNLLQSNRLIGGLLLLACTSRLLYLRRDDPPGTERFAFRRRRRIVATGRPGQ